jgi:TolB protein
MKLGRETLKIVVGAVAAALLVTPTTTALPAGQQAGAASIPWAQVGPGWLLSEWAPVAPSETSGPARRSVLYLVDPRGGRYAITTVATLGASLVDWSGDGRRALFETQTTTSSVVTVLDLQNGRSNTFRVAGTGPPAVSFTAPDGLGIIASGQETATGPSRVQRFSLEGALEYSYPLSFPGAGRVNGDLVYSADGTELVLGTSGGFEVVANTGQPLRYLPMSANAGTCQPARWWAAGVLLASCTRPNSGIPLLWLVPTNGQPPTPLTLTPKRGSGDYGDVDAWSLPSGDYVQVLGACGYIYLGRLGRTERTVPVRVPGIASGKSVHVVGAVNDQLALTASFSCSPGSASLMWFDPATDVVRPLLGPPVNGGSVGTTFLWRQTPPFSEF